ncbi:glycerol kinase GlpK [Neobacillus sp. Marseille-QA0830]
MSEYILSIDQSTSGTKVLMVNSEGNIIYKKSKSHRQIYPQPGWVEHDPMEIYQNVKELIDNAIQFSGVSRNELKGLSITNQRETIVVWDQQTGEPVYNAIVWQCQRTAQLCKELKGQGYEKIIESKTGLTLDPYFSATKVKWIFENVQGAAEKAKEGKLLLGTIDSWLIWKLTGKKVHATDYTNASRTLLYNIHSLTWDEELVELFSVSKGMLPEVKNSADIFGHTDFEELSISLPISGVIGDSQGALFGQKCFHKGMAKATFGTGTSVLVQTEELVEGSHGLVTSLAWGIGGKAAFALEGIIRTTGDIIKWLQDDLELIRYVEQLEPLAVSVNDNGGVYLIPAFVGLGAPYWSPDTRAAIVGMNRSTKKAHIVRAALESMVYQVKDVIELIEAETQNKISVLNVDGGATSNRFLMQFLADMLETKVRVSEVSELSALGSVYLAGLGFGIWNSFEDISKLNQNAIEYEPTMAKEERSGYYTAWKNAVNSILV